MRLIRAMALVGFGAICLWSFSGTTSIPDGVDSSQYEFTYRVQIPRPDKKFKSLRVWMPLPADNHEQKILSEQVATEVRYRTVKEKKYGNRILYADIYPNQKFPLTINVTYTIERKQAKAVPMGELSEPNYWTPSLYLGVDKKVPITGIIKEIAVQQTKGIDGEWGKIRRMYQYVVESMTYSKEGTGWGQGDAIWACSSKRGNCTDFHSLFIGMARSQKIPARFEIGFSVPPEGKGVIPGYHCWARVYSGEKGWIPLDASEAKKSGKLFEYLGWLPQNRIHFTTGRDLILEPKQKGQPLNYFIFPYMELDGQAFDTYTKEFNVKTI